MTVRERTLTDFLRQTGEILPELERGEIILKRRDGADIVVMSRDHWQALAESLRFFAEVCTKSQALSNSSSGSQSSWFAFPWIALLSEEDQNACVHELTQATVATLEFGRSSYLRETIDQWRATALATWDDSRRRDDPIYRGDAPQPLSRP
jgi:hypothetical protein